MTIDSPDSPAEQVPTFAELGLGPNILRALQDIGYESPSAIQARIIPPILDGRDVIGQAQTGTGKTGAFALPLINGLDLTQRDPQILVLTPTRELAIQVAEAFQRYAAHLQGFHVLPIYGGSGYDGQLRQLKRGVHVVVGTPGRLCDHLRRGTLNMSQLKTFVIDEADEMLRMGFIEEVEWILEHAPEGRQVALFSATMPPQIRKIAQTYLTDPAEITIEEKTATVSTIRQRFWMVSGLHKLDALTRILEGENFEAMIIFVRTRNATIDLAKSLNARGYAVEALNGDIPQNRREQIVEELKSGEIDIVIATDVAARGLDVPRITHVINYDIPEGTEPYIHRIGRTGRAGRSGEAILFVAPRERRMLQAIERATRQTIEPMQLPSREIINDQRIARFKERITAALDVDDRNDFYINLLEEFRMEQNIPAIEIAAALAKLLQGDEPFLLEAEQKGERRERRREREDERPVERSERSERPVERREERDVPSPRTAFANPAPKRIEVARPESLPKAPEFFERTGDEPQFERPEPKRKRAEEHDEPRFDRSEERRPKRDSYEDPTDEDGNPLVFERYVLEVGNEHGVKPGQIVGAIANESGLEGSYIRKLRIGTSQSTVELPEGMPEEVSEILARAKVCGRPLRLRLLEEGEVVAGTEGFGERKPFSDRPSFGDRPRFNDRGDRPKFSDRGDRPSFGDRPKFSDRGDRPSFGDRPKFADRGDRPKFADRGDRPKFQDRDDKPRFSDRNERPSYGDRDKPSYGGDKPRFSDRGDRPSYGDKPKFGDRDRSSFGDKPSFGDRDKSGPGGFGFKKPKGPRPTSGGPSGFQKPSFAKKIKKNRDY